MNDLEANLRAETLKWLSRAEERLLGIRPDQGDFLENVVAYVGDARYFLEKGDLIRAFEAVIWAWAWMEIGERVGALEQRGRDSQEKEDDSS